MKHHGLPYCYRLFYESLYDGTRRHLKHEVGKKERIKFEGRFYPIGWSEGDLMTVKAYVMMKVSSGSEREICKKIIEFDEVMDVSIVYGEFDVVAKVKVEELEALEDFLSENLRNMPAIMLTSTMIVAREYKGKAKRNALKVEKLNR